jgi:CelD/BcsL family acetyltransferase involved in cellulose biosynthesis
MATAELIDDIAGLERWKEPWDRLAVEVGQPYSMPSWMLAWWRHAVPGTAELRSVVVRDGDELIGIAPYFVQLGSLGLSEYRVLGAGAAHRIGPIAQPGREAEVAAAVAETLDSASPRPSSFHLEGVDQQAPWASLMRQAWPGRLRPTQRQGNTMQAPTLILEGTDYETWYGSRSSNFRQKMRQKRRQAERRGAEIRLATSQEQIDEGLDSMFEQHRERWAARGLEGSLKPGTEEHLREVVAELLPSQRARLWTMVADGRTVCSHLFFVAGREVASWGGGFDPDWKDQSPAQLVILAAVEDAWSRGERRVDWGGGILDYKLRFATDDEPVTWIALIPKNSRYPLTRAQAMPKAARTAVRDLVRKLPEPTVDRLRRARARITRR